MTGITLNYSLNKKGNPHAGGAVDLTFALDANDPGAAQLYPNGVPTAAQTLQFPLVDGTVAASLTLGDPLVVTI